MTFNEIMQYLDERKKVYWERWLNARQDYPIEAVALRMVQNFGT